MSNVNTFGNLFSDALKTEFSEADNAPFRLQKNVRAISSAEVAQLFPQKDKLWLIKELSKWKNKVLGEDGNFNPTLQNLYIFCTLTNRTPNDVLLPNLAYSGPDRIEYLSYDALVSLIENIMKKGKISGNYMVPVMYAPEKMVAAFLSIYSKKVQYQENIYVQFSLSYVDKRFDEDSFGGFTTTSVDNRFLEYNVSISEKNPFTFYEYYSKMTEAFDSVTGDLQEIILDEFYGEFGSWASELFLEKDPLCKYFPLPSMRTTLKKGKTLDEMFTPRKDSHTFTIETER